MDWSVKIFGYCERGSDPSLWAEPLNAVSNLAFLLAAYFAARHYRMRRGRRDYVPLTLIALVGLIGVGSLLMHTLATRWAALADIAPIALFTLVYLAFAMRRYAGAGATPILAAMAALLGASALLGVIGCSADLLPQSSVLGRPCLNGSLPYLPTWLALTGMAVYLAAHGHGAAGFLAKASALLALSLVLRTIDFQICAVTELWGQPRGSHALWHLLNGLVLYALLRAAVDSGPIRRAGEP